ncbi:unnamed protein product [Aphis gossypii]|uniref:Uncharacterized protein n=1 Tax=Aphis gossypii TaxID=80765 RepID=A0A9P0J3V9_APHGO|nr:unnamed protein product [Aphis gossypii]
MSSSSSSSNDSNWSSTTSNSEWLLTTMWRTCPIDFILKDEVLKIILKRGMMDGMYARASMESALNSEGAPLELVKAATVMNITNYALMTSKVAIEAASLALNLAKRTIMPFDHTITNRIMETALTVGEETMNAVKTSRIVLQNSIQSLGSHELHD